MNNPGKLSLTLALTIGLTGSAVAGDPKAGGAPAPQPPKADPGKKAPDASIMPVGDAKPVTPGKPPQELLDAAKAMVGTWRCTGKGIMDPSNPTTMTDMKMTVTFKQDLNKWWIVGTLAGGPMRGMMYRTYDPTARKWFHMGMDNLGGSETMWSMGPKDGKTTWEGEARMMGMTVKTRSTEELSPKQVVLGGEASMDGGKTWMKSFEATCKK